MKRPRRISQGVAGDLRRGGYFGNCASCSGRGSEGSRPGGLPMAADFNRDVVGSNVLVLALVDLSDDSSEPGQCGEPPASSPPRLGGLFAGIPPRVCCGFVGLRASGWTRGRSKAQANGRRLDRVSHVRAWRLSSSSKWPLTLPQPPSAQSTASLHVHGWSRRDPRLPR